jgi:uncharacterized protein
MKALRPAVAASLAALVCLAAPAAPAFGQGVAPRPSFSCAKVRSAPERLICGDVELARLDRILSDLYAETRSLLMNAQQGAEADKVQRAWLAKRNRCTAVQCLRQLHFNRIAELARELPSE